MTFSDDLTVVFAHWDERLRGWDMYDYPVRQEPNYVPLHAYFEPASASPTQDDGRESTLLSALADGVKGAFKKVDKYGEVEQLEDGQEFEFEPDVFLSPPEKLDVFQVALPTDYEGSLTTYKNLVRSLRFADTPISFEIIGTKDQITVQFATWKRNSEKLLTQIRAHVPQATVLQDTDLIDENVFSGRSLVVDFGLEHSVLHSLDQLRDLKHDPLTAMVGSMDDLKESERCIFQILLSPVNQPWEIYLRDAPLDNQGDALFADGADLIAAVKEKTSSPIYACNMRIAIISTDKARRMQLAKQVSGALAQYDVPARNNLMPLTNDDYDRYDHLRDVVDRTTHRSGMLLSLNELVSFVHFPDKVVKSEKLFRQRLKTKAAPDLAYGHQLILGENIHRGETKLVSLSESQRTRHMYVVGASGTGKSTLLLNCIRQDIQNNQGICVLDPHGDLIDKVLTFVPEERISDVILLDPSDEEHPIGLNIFDAHSNLEKTLLASDLTSVFERLSTTWGDQMSTVLSQGVLAMLESSENATLHDLRRFLIERDFREAFLETVADQEVVYYWRKQFPLLSGRPQASVLTRLDTFLRPKPIRYMVSQRKSAIDFAKVMDQGNILLAKLSHGGIGEENSYLLGALLASKIHQTALARQSVSEDRRKPFWLYIDEFQNFLTPSIAHTLSGARKYSLGMVLAHQELTQLSLNNKAIAASVIANPYTRICFRMGDRDARTLSEGYSNFDSKDLQSLGIGEAIGRIEQAAYDFSLNTYPLPEDDDAELTGYKVEAIRKASRDAYGTPLTEVEALLGVRAKSNKVNSQSESSNNTKPDIPSETNEERGSKEGAISKSNEGKGGDQHKEIQQYIKQIARDKGFAVTVEYHIGEGRHIDLLINTGIGKIACEISVTTTAEHEVENIQKCLDAGFEDICMICDDGKKLAKIKALARDVISPEYFVKLLFLYSDEIVKVLDSLARPISATMVRGYQVKREWKNISDAERKRRELVFSKIVGESNHG